MSDFISIETMSHNTLSNALVSPEPDSAKSSSSLSRFNRLSRPSYCLWEWDRFHIFQEMES